MNQPDQALQQFDRSLAIDPRHTKTLLNVGIVRAFGKEDLEGAAQAWQRVVEITLLTRRKESARSRHWRACAARTQRCGARGTGSKPPGSPD